MQTGVGALTPNNFASVASVVRYGTSASALSKTATGNAEVRHTLLWVTLVSRTHTLNSADVPSAAAHADLCQLVVQLPGLKLVACECWWSQQ